MITQPEGISEKKMRTVLKKKTGARSTPTGAELAAPVKA